MSFTANNSQGVKSNEGVASDGGSFSFSAQKSSAIYGKASNVQPPASQVLIIIKT